MRTRTVRLRARATPFAAQARRASGGVRTKVAPMSREGALKARIKELEAMVAALTLKQGMRIAHNDDDDPVRTVRNPVVDDEGRPPVFLARSRVAGRRVAGRRGRRRTTVKKSASLHLKRLGLPKMKMWELRLRRELDVSGRPNMDRRHWSTFVRLVLPSMKNLVTFDISNNRISGDEAKELGKVLTGNQVMTKLNMASNSLDWNRENERGLDGVVAISNAISTMRALTSFDISNNDIRAEGSKLLAEALKDNQVMRELNIADNNMSNYDSDMSGIIAISNAIPTMGALTRLNLSNNEMLTKRAGKALAGALASNAVLRELDVSKQGGGAEYDDGPGFAMELADGLGTNGALTSLNISSCDIGELVLPDGWTREWMWEEFQGKGYKHSDGRKQEERPGKPEGAIAIANAIKNNGSLVKLNLSKCCLHGAESGKAVGDMLASNTSLKELDLSGYGPDSFASSDAEFAQAFAVGLSANGVLTSLDISNNNLAKGSRKNPDWTHVRGKYDDYYIHKDGKKQKYREPADLYLREISGVLALADAIKNNGVLTSLDLGHNNFRKKEKATLRACQSKTLSLVL